MKTGKNESSSLSKNKRKMFYLVTIGMVITFFIFIFYLSVGQYGIYNIFETIEHLIDYIRDPSNKFNTDATVIGVERLPRAMAAFAVGVGLSVAGAMYQAVIRNPLVDPYIMGVSSGAGVAAIAVIAFDFTLFGLLSSAGMFTIPIAAIIGGVSAFFITMILAEKAGGSAINYILAGIIIGLALSAVQTMLLQMSAGQDLPQAITWLFGSFDGMRWSKVWYIFIPVLLVSIIPLFNVREFNLVLLGEDQAKQMGLDSRKFGRNMLIIASIITSLCVAFVGIIGFVGLVVPHICRMILGGDHRFVIPASMMLGGCLMLMADLLAKTLQLSAELPVGAITTLIGVPVFAYLLIKRGRMYDG